MNASTETEDRERQVDADLYDLLGPRAFKKEYGPDDLFVALCLSAIATMTPDQFYIYAVVAYEQFVVNFKAGPYHRGIRYLSDLSGLSQAKVSDVLTELDRMGWVRVINRGTKATAVDVVKAPQYNRSGNLSPVAPQRKSKKVSPTIDPSTGKPVKRTATKCAGLKSDGVRCGQYVTGTTHCRWHVDQGPAHEMDAALPTRWVQSANEKDAACTLHMEGVPML